MRQQHTASAVHSAPLLPFSVSCFFTCATLFSPMLVPFHNTHTHTHTHTHLHIHTTHSHTHAHTHTHTCTRTHSHTRCRLCCLPLACSCLSPRRCAFESRTRVTCVARAFTDSGVPIRRFGSSFTSQSRPRTLFGSTWSVGTQALRFQSQQVCASVFSSVLSSVCFCFQGLWFW